MANFKMQNPVLKTNKETKNPSKSVTRITTKATLNRSRQKQSGGHVVAAASPRPPTPGTVPPELPKLQDVGE